MNEREEQFKYPKYSRRQALGLLGGVGAGLLTRPFRAFAQEIAEQTTSLEGDQPVAAEEKDETGPTSVESRHDYDKIRLYYPVEFNNLPREQRIEYNLALRRSREWLKKLFTSTDQLNHTKLNEYVDQFMMAVAHIPPAENVTYLSDFEIVMPFFLPRGRMEELGIPITEQGFHSPFISSIDPWSVKPNGVRYAITIREPYLPQESKFEYNDPSKNAYPTLMFGYTMDRILSYHAQVEELDLGGRFNRDEFVAQTKEPTKFIYPMAESLKTVVGIQQELGFKNVPVFDILLVQRQVLELRLPPEQVEFGWRKYIWSVFISKDIPVDQLR